MKLEYHNPKDEGRFIITNFQCEASSQLLKESNLYKILWCQSGTSTILVDGYRIELTENQVLFCTPVNILELAEESSGLLAFVFNQEFYCIQQNDSEVSCMGLLFFGSQQAPVAHLDEQHKKSFDAMLTLFQEEFKTKDHIQGEMLRSLLKRMLITATRLIQNNHYSHDLSVKQVDLIRKYHILVEQHFKEKHQVAEYAELLFKSPKTLSNFFKKHQVASPLKIINERITAEAKRLLLYSDKSAEEISYELGYNEPSHFSKFFKKQTGKSPLAFRKQA